MRFLVAGAGGQLGQALRLLRRPEWEIVGLRHDQLDITDSSAIATALHGCRPDVVVNAAAFTAVDAAERDVAAAYTVNRDGAMRLAAASHAAGIAFIHVSTDFVFDGAVSRPYRPDDEPNPINVYGASKLAGEQAVLEAAPGALVIRTSWLHSLYGRNFVTNMLRLLRDKGRVGVVADQYGSPTSARRLAHAIGLAARRKVIGNRGSPDRLFGVRHFAGTGIVSWYDLAAAVRDEGVAAGLLPSTVVVDPIRTQDYPSVARRPPYSGLDSSLLRTELNLPELGWRDALAEIFRQGASQFDQSGTSGSGKSALLGAADDR